MASSSSSSTIIETDEELLEYRPGDIIQPYCYPFIKILHKSERGTRCNHCFRLLVGGNFKPCNCHKVLYCNQNCKKNDWENGHKMECSSSLFKNICDMHSGVLNPNLIFKILRTVAVSHLHPDERNRPHKIWDGSSKTYNDLLSHDEEFENKTEYGTLSMMMAQHIKHDESFGAVKHMEIKDLRRIIGIWGSNSFSIVDDTMISAPVVGTGIFIQPSFFDHSCRPNAVRVITFPSCAMQIRCIAPIPKGEKPCITYLAGIRSREKRQLLLTTRYNFNCHCDLCEKEITVPATDYTTLKSHLDETPDCEFVSSEVTLKAYYETLNLFRALFHKFDLRVTNYCASICEGLVLRYHHHADISDNVISFLLKDTLERIKTTFGSEHAEYIGFCKQVGKIGFMVVNDENGLINVF